MVTTMRKRDDTSRLHETATLIENHIARLPLMPQEKASFLTRVATFTAELVAKLAREQSHSQRVRLVQDGYAFFNMTEITVLNAVIENLRSRISQIGRFHPPEVVLKALPVFEERLTALETSVWKFSRSNYPVKICELEPVTVECLNLEVMLKPLEQIVVERQRSFRHHLIALVIAISVSLVSIPITLAAQVEWDGWKSSKPASSQQRIERLACPDYGVFRYDVRI